MINYDIKKVKTKLEQYVNTCNVNILIGAGFSKPSLPDMNEIKIIFKEIIESLSKKESVDDLSNNLIKNNVDKYLINKETDIITSINEIYSYFKDNLLGTDYARIVASLTDPDINFEEILYKSNIERVILNKGNNLSNCFIFLFFKIFKIIKIKEEYRENINKIQELIKWLF